MNLIFGYCFSHSTLPSPDLLKCCICMCCQNETGLWWMRTRMSLPSPPALGLEASDNLVATWCPLFLSVYVAASDYGLFLSDEDPRKGIWLEAGRTLDYYMLRNGVRCWCWLDSLLLCLWAFGGIQHHYTILIHGCLANSFHAMYFLRLSRWWENISNPDSWNYTKKLKRVGLVC